VGEMDEDHESSGQHVKQQLRQQVQPAPPPLPGLPEAQGAPRLPGKPAPNSQATWRNRRAPGT